MLRQLNIKNYALIRQLEIQPSAHLNVITGETGAGKSIMLGAIGLLLGNRADAKVLWDEESKCIVEGVFDIAPYQIQSLFKEQDLDYQDQTVIRREINPGGKSRAFINDTPVTLEVMRKVGNRLMDIHSQHETLEIGKRSFQLNLIDAFAGNSDLREAYQTCWNEYVQAKSLYDSLLNEAKIVKQEFDFVKFQLEELTLADLQNIDQEGLERQLTVLEHAEEIKTQLNGVITQLDESEFSARSILSSACTLLNTVSNYAPNYQKIHERLDSLRIELDDIIKETGREEQKVEYDEQQSTEIKNRLNTLYQLTQKHRVQTVEELIQIKESLQLKFDKATGLEDEINEAKTKLEKYNNELQLQAKKLSQSRQQVFEILCKKIVVLLQDLGITDASLKIQHSVTPPTATGIDSIEVFFSANKGVELKPMAQVASGGEFSRLMFSIKYIMAEKTFLPTLILDEIDSGISGEIAMQLGRMMKQMADRHQLITITHLPQIAAKGEAHYFVYKDNTTTKAVSLIKRLKQEERIDEIAKMIAGDNPSTFAVQSAKELLQN